MFRHSFEKKKPCPAIVQNLELTKDIKNYVLANCIYREKAKEPEHQHVTNVNIQTTTT